MSNITSFETTINDIRDKARNWSLEGDSNLLNLMKNISKNLETRCLQTSKNINKMLLNLDETQISLGNTTNKLMALSHTQFIENRVYDEDETIANTENIPKISINNNNNNNNSNEQFKLNTMAILQTAIDNGLKVMNKYYEKITIDLGDEDDESDENDEPSTPSEQKNVVYRQKDPYINQPVPHIIGSTEWREKWHVGLLDSDDEEKSINEPGEEYSESSNDGDEDEVQSSLSVSLPSNNTPTTVSESEYSAMAGLYSSNHIESKHDLFTHSSDENLFSHSHISKPPVQQIVQPSKPQQQQQQQPSKSNVIKQHDNNINDNSINKDNSNNIFDESFDSYKSNVQPSTTTTFYSEEPPPDTGNYEKDIGKQHKPVNLFFDTDDEEDDFFSQMKPVKIIPITTNKNPEQNIPNTSSIIDKNSTAVPPPPPSPSPPRISKRVNIFDDDVDDDLDDFYKSLMGKQAQPSKSTPPPPPSTIYRTKPSQNEPKKYVNLFDDELVDDLFETQLPTTENKSKTIDNTISVNQSEVISDTNSNVEDILSTKSFDYGVKNEKQQNKISSNLFNDPDDPIDEPSDSEFTKLFNKSPVLNKTSMKSNLFFDDFSDTNDDFSSIFNTKITKSSRVSIDSGSSNLITSKNNDVDEFFEQQIPSVDVTSNIFSNDEQTSDNLFNVDQPVETVKILDEAVSSEPIKNKEHETNSDNLFNQTVEENKHSESLLSNKDPDKQFNNPINYQSSFSSFLNEEPPPTLHNIFTDNDRDTDNTTSNNTTNTISQQKSALDYSSFQDEPPEDDFSNVSNISVKTPIHIKTSQVFYDDFADTIINKTSLSSSSSLTKSTNYLFNELPPSDDEYDVVDKVVDKISTESVEEVIRVQNNDKFNNLKKMYEDHIEEDLIKSKPSTVIKSLPKKLNVNLDINVSALLPNARPTTNTSRKDSITSLNDDNPISQNDDEAFSKLENNLTTNTSSNSTIEQSSDLLVCLNKSRTKINQKRRPSTRKGRQEEYRKYLLSNVNEIMDNIEDYAENKPIISTDDQQRKSTTITPINENANPFTVESNHTNIQSNPNETDNDEDWLLKSDTDYLGAESHQQQLSTEEELNTNEYKSNNSSFLYHPSEPPPMPDDANSEFKSITTSSYYESELPPPSPTLSSSPPPFIREETTKLFIDGDDEDDDLFSKLSTRKDSLPKQSAPQATPPPPAQQPPSKIVKKSTAKIFDSDDDDDDLFASTRKTLKEPVQSSNKNKVVETLKPKSLFNDSSSDSEDIFGGSNKKSKDRIETVKPSANIKRNLETSTNVVTTSKIESTTHDPLADLWKS